MLTAVLAAVFFVVAIGFSMLGQGGGAIFTPIQVLAGVPFHTAATTSLFLIIIVSLSSTMVFRKGGRLDLPLAAVLEGTTVIGAFAGGIGSEYVGGDALTIAFAAFILLAALSMIVPMKPAGRSRRMGPAWACWQRQLGTRRYQVNLLIGLPGAFAAGLASGLLGIGGGVFKVPLMVLLLGVPMDIAVGASALMVGVTASAGFAGHVMRGHWDWRLSLVLAVAVFIGAQLGARFSLRIRRRRLRRIFGWFLIAIAILMTAKALGAHLPG